VGVTAQQQTTKMGLMVALAVGLGLMLLGRLMLAGPEHQAKGLLEETQIS
jgi:hypothetical protein